MGENVKLKKILIISPHFPPINAPDMQRIRQSLPYYKELGFYPIIVCSDSNYIEGYSDESLIKTIPSDIEVIKIKGLPYRITRLFGLGNLGLRSFIHYAIGVNKILKKRKIDLIFFSTTVFPLLVLGAYWKKKFNIPYIIDMQDPWLDFETLKKPKELRPKKFWFMHSVNKFLEPIALRNADGVIAVTRQYLDVLKTRYKNITDENTEVITFGYSIEDFKVAEKESIDLDIWKSTKTNIRGVYTGVVNNDMLPVIEVIFKAFKDLLTIKNNLTKNVKLFFIGTNYATGGFVKEMVKPLAIKYGIEENIVEVTYRLNYLKTIKLMMEADFLLLVGSTNKAYTASKLYPYLFSQKPLLAVFNKESSVISIIKKISSVEPIAFESEKLESFPEAIKNQLFDILNNSAKEININLDELNQFSAETLTQRQVNFFNKILSRCQRN